MPDSISVQTPHRGRLFSVEVLTWTDAAGRTITREVVRHPGAVLIVPVLDDGRLVLLRNYRVAVDDHLWELPAGTLEPGEAPREAAGRELIEETGYRAARIEHLGDFYTSPGFCDELMRVFTARELSFVGQDLEPHEQIEAHALHLDEVRGMLADGRIRDGKTIAALAMWRRRGRPSGDGAG